MNQFARDVNASATDPNRAVIEALRNKIANIVRASFDVSGVSRSGLQILGLIAESEVSCWLGYEAFAKEIHKRTGASNCLDEKTIQNELSELKGHGYITREKRKTPEAKGAKLTHYQIAFLAAAIARERNVVPFPSRHSRTNPPSTEGKSRAGGTDHPAPTGKSRRGGSRRGNNTSYYSPGGKERSRASAPPQAAAFLASGLFVKDDLGGFVPEPSLAAKHRATFRDVPYDAVCAEVISDGMKFKHSPETIMARIVEQCRRLANPLPLTTAKRSAPQPAAILQERPKPLTHNGETIMLGSDHWSKWKDKYVAAQMPREKSSVFEAAKAFAVPVREEPV